MTIQNTPITQSDDIAKRLAAVQARIASACRLCQRDPDSVALLAVSKGQALSALESMAALGQRAFGENYLDEALGKMAALSAPGLEWHFIGPVQSNKTRGIAEHFDWVHSVDRSKIIQRLSDQRPAEMAPLNVLIQVNVDDESQKAGCPVDQLGTLAEAIARSPRLLLRGLMAIPAPRHQQRDQIEVFERLHGLYLQLKAGHPRVDTLSAGMSGDLEAAITAGSTMVRVGTDLFGPRSRPAGT